MAEISGVNFMVVTWSPYANKGTPADVPIDTAFDLPTGFPEIQALVGGTLMESTAGVQALVPLLAVIPAAVLGGGNMSQVSGNSIKLGTICTIDDTISITYRYV